MKEIKAVVREGYAKVAKKKSSCCGQASSCCGGSVSEKTLSKRIGYSDEELGALPEGANLGLGCGNPVALAGLKVGETVLDLGSGAGIDCFLASQRVGKTGHVIGVDMTPEMIDRARANAKKGGYTNVEFRLGEIEALPAKDGEAEVIISNCVINLSPEKEKVFAEAFRVLKSGGRLFVSDIVLLKELPEKIRKSAEAYVGCLAGAVLKDEYLSMIQKAGFRQVRVLDQALFPVDCMANDPTAQAVMKDLRITEKEMKALGQTAASVKVSAIK